MSEYPTLKGFAKWLAIQALPFFIATTFFYALGYHFGHDAGRLEMKCAIFAVVERLGEDSPAPGTITLGCKKTTTASRLPASVGGV